MLKVGQLYGELSLDKRPFDKTLSDAEGSTRGWASKVGGIVGGVAKNLLKFGMIAGAAVGGFGFVSANMASDLEESMNKVRVVFGENGDALVNWADDAAINLGMSKDAALGALGTYGNLFRAMGIGVDASQDMSTGLVELSADLASFNNMDPTEVLDKLRAGLAGETEPLRTLGVNLNQARIEEKALEMGLWDGVGAIDAAAKAQATYALIMQDTSLAQGDFERTSGGMANQQRILAATFTDTMAAVGAAFMPLIVEMLPGITAAMGQFAAWVTTNMPTIQAVIGEVMSFIGAAISFVFTEIVPRLVEIFSALFGQVQSNMPTIQAIVSSVFDTVGAVISFVTTNIIPPLMAAVRAIVTWIAANWPTISSVAGQVFGAIGNIIRTVWPIIERVASVLFPMVGAAATVLFSVLDFVFKGIGGVFEVAGAIAKAIGAAIKAAFDGLGGFFKGIWDKVGGVFRGGLNFLVDIVNGFLGWLNNLRIDIPRVEVAGVGIGGGSIDPFNFNLLPRFASGVRGFGGGMAIVGERGPELVNLPRGADVYSNAQSRSMLGGSVEVVLRDPDRAIASGGYSHTQLETMLNRALNEMVSGLQHAAVRT